MRGGRNRGFTLIELITVLVILSIVSVGISGFIRTGVQVYLDVAERDQVLGQSRLVIERIKRDIRSALPNSLRVSSSATVTCLEFMPVKWGSFYFDVPVAPEPASSSIKVVTPDTSLNPYVFQSTDSVVVAPILGSDLYSANSTRRFGLNSVPTLDASDSKKTVISLPNAVQFMAESPSSRAYIVGLPVSYCFANQQITRHQDYGLSAVQLLSPGNAVLMAENVLNDINGSSNDKPFRLGGSFLTGDAYLLMLLRFKLGEQMLVFSNEVHVPNVP